jgi:hypothetical protein
MKTSLLQQLLNFAKQPQFKRQGGLCVALIITERARDGLPLNPDNLVTNSGGQVEGLGKAGVQAILARHGIIRVLAEEGGRTSRGSIDNMRLYVKFLNGLSVPIDFDVVEKFWVDRVNEFFAGKPFKFHADSALSVRVAVRNVLEQARERQSKLMGSRYEGTMLQHLVGAKLDIVLGVGKVMHHSASEADEAEGRAGDFVLGDVAIHVTTHPSEALIAKCERNLSAGLRPLIVTIGKKTFFADTLAEHAKIGSRLDVLDIEQFLAANLYERALFSAKDHLPKTTELLLRYNKLIDEYETDPSLKIEIAG